MSGAEWGLGKAVVWARESKCFGITGELGHREGVSGVRGGPRCELRGGVRELFRIREGGYCGFDCDHEGSLV